jgi:DNA-binding transcriptional MocR family regulator
MTWEPTPPISRPLYRDLVDQIRAAIRAGDLRPGDRLPTHRQLARTAGVTVSTATEAYREAARLHLVAGEVGRGTYVLADSGDADLFAATGGRSTTRSCTGNRATGGTRDSTVDLSANTPVVHPDPGELASALALAVADGAVGGYPSTATLLRGRLAMEQWLIAHGIDHQVEQIQLTAGAQQALLVAVATLAGPGAAVLAERLTFPGLVALSRVLRLRLVPVATDQRGIIPDDLDRQAARSGATVAVVVPTLQNPTGSTMDDERRRAVTEVARQRQLTFVEDDVYRALTDEPALATVAPERTVVVSGLSKTVEPALRLGAVSGPDELIRAIGAETHLHQWLVNPVAIEVFARWIADGTAERRTHWQRGEVEARWRLAASVLGPAPGPPSPHRFVTVTRSPDRLAAELAGAGVMVSPSPNHGVGARPPKGLRLSLTAATSRAVLHHGLARLNQVVGAWIARD